MWFGWPESGIPVPMQNASAWQAAGVPDPVQCRAMRRLALAVWFRQAEMAALKPTEERYPHAVVPVAVLNGMENWRTHRLEETEEGLVMRSPGGQVRRGLPRPAPRASSTTQAPWPVSPHAASSASSPASPGSRTGHNVKINVESEYQL